MNLLLCYVSSDGTTWWQSKTASSLLIKLSSRPKSILIKNSSRNSKSHSRCGKQTEHTWARQASENQNPKESYRAWNCNSLWTEGVSWSGVEGCLTDVCTCALLNFFCCLVCVLRKSSFPSPFFLFDSKNKQRRFLLISQMPSRRPSWHYPLSMQQ